MSLYSVLGVAPDADAATLKAAFRRRVKELHPDLRPADAPAPRVTIHEVIEAYEVLSDPRRRDAYDQERRSGTQESSFDYREWLKARNDPESKAKLIFYDVLRARSDDALALYREFSASAAGAPTADLERLLGREDFMDCAFMLALGFEGQGDDVQAVALYRRLAQLEGQKPFFRHFFVEVEEHLVTLLVQRRPGWDPRDLTALFEEFQTLPFRTATKAAFLVRQAEVYHGAGERLAARRSLDRARALAPRDRKIAALERSWGLR